MANKIKPKRSYTANSVPLTTDLEQNELAINWADGKAYTKNAAGQILSITLGGSGGSSSSEDTALRAYFLPTAPTNVTATAGNGQASVTWTASTTIAQIPVTDYVVQYSSNSGSTWTTFSDGTSTSTSATVTGLTNGTAYTFRVAAVNGVGTGAYSTASSAVTPANATDPNFSNVSLLLHMDGSNGSTTFTDSSASPKTVTANGNAAISTGTKKFGTGSLALDGSGDYLSVANSSALDFGTGDFTVEAWVYASTSVSTAQQIFYSASSGGWFIGLFTNGELGIGRTGVAWDHYASHSMQVNTWHHIAVTRSGSMLKLFVDGAQIGSNYTNSQNYTLQGGALYIGGPGGSEYMWNGYIDDVRITKGVARTITVPTAAFPDS